MSKKERRSVPVLRFKGFTDDWEQRKFGDFWKLKSGKAYKASEYVNKGIPIINGETIKNGEIKSKNLNYLPKRYLLIKDNIILKPDDVVIGLNRPIINNQLKISPIPKNIPVSFLYQRAGKIESKFSNLSTIETYYLLERNIFNFSKITAIGSDQPFIKTSALLSWKFFIPKEIEEKTINKLLAKISTLIFLQQRKTQLLNKVIKYLTQNLFIQSASLTPVLRFLSFNKKWTSTKIGKIMDVGSVKRIHQSDWRESGIPFYRARDIIAIRQNKELPSPIYISHEQYENYSETSGKVNMNDLLVTGVGTIGVPLLVKKTPIYFKDGNIIWLKNSNKLNGNFLFYVFQSSKIQDYIHSIAGVGTVPTYTIDSAKKTPIVFPEKSEQTDIANLLNTVTNMVHMSKSKKRVLMSIKNYLLQNMFI